LARSLVQIENEWALQERQRLLDLGLNKTPTMTREEILSIVATAWLSIDHERVAAKGYKQTGPTMPLRGPVAPEDVFKDLLRVMEELDPSSTPTEVGMTLRDEAVAFVKDGFDSGKWTEWSHCHKLIEEHDGECEAAEEGMEAFGADPVDSDAEESDESDSDDDGTPGGGGCSGGLSAKPADADGGPEDGGEHGASDGGEDNGDGTFGGGGCSGGPSAKPIDADGGPEDGGIATAADSNRPIEIAAARQVLYDEAVRNRNDLMLKHMRIQIRGETQKQRDAGTEISVLLRKRGQEHREAEAKRRREVLKEERLAAKDLEETKVITAKASQAAAEARLASLRQIVLNRRDAQARKHEEGMERAFQRWLQTQYPAMLGRRCLLTRRGLSKESRQGFEREISKLLKAGTFQRQVFVNDLWSSDKSFTLAWTYAAPFTGGPPRSVRCGLTFQELVDQEAPRSIQLVDKKPQLVAQDPVETLYRLFSACVPRARDVFTGPYGPLRLLHINDYVLEKTFVYGIVALSKWLGEERFPHGVYGKWPPKAPANLPPRYEGSESVNLDTIAPTLAPPLLAQKKDKNLPPHLRIGSAAASSGSKG
jgi:hypothetical protein